MIDKKQNFFADPILDPIHYGFADSIERFVKIRKKFPNIKLFMVLEILLNLLTVIPLELML